MQTSIDFFSRTKSFSPLVDYLTRIKLHFVGMSKDRGKKRILYEDIFLIFPDLSYPTEKRGILILVSINFFSQTEFFPLYLVIWRGLNCISLCKDRRKKRILYERSVHNLFPPFLIFPDLSYHTFFRKRRE